MKTTGYAKFKDFQEFLSWYQSLNVETAETAYKEFSGVAEKVLDKDGFHIVTAAMHKAFKITNWASYPPEKTREAQWPEFQKKHVRRLENFFMFMEDFEQQARVGFWEENKFAFIYMGNANQGVVVPSPEKYLEYIPEKDYSNVTPNEMRLQLNAPNGVDMSLVAGAGTNLTVSQMDEKLLAHEKAMSALKERIDQAQRCESPELISMKQEIEKLQKEMDEKKWALMRQLEEKMEEMEETKFNLEGQIFLLDSQIYSILCYAGEVVKFAKLRSGKNAPVTEPIVVHQKLRFLDEELGRMASLYEIEWQELGLFEKFLQHHPQALDTFAPNERCVVLIRLSKSGKQIGMDNEHPYQNLLADYEYYHGRTVGIIIRNGENLYLGWTDEKRVKISDDLIITNVVTEITPGEEIPEFRFESDRKKYIREKREEKRGLVEGLISRSFIYSILQGVVDNTPILPLPDGVKLSKQSEYVIYSVADKWLSDNRFGSFNEIVEKCNAVVHEGDILLTTQRLIPEREYGFGYRQYDQTWRNVRGRGDKNRTHDCHVDDNTFYKANVVEYGEPYFTAKYQRKDKKSPVYRTQGKTPEEILKNFTDEVEVFDIEEVRDRHVFVSVKKTGWSRSTWDETNARSNFELYDGEFINLTYMNSVWLEWAITNKNLGGWTIANKVVEYAYAIRYLKNCLEFVRNREEEEKSLLDAVNPGICRDPEWSLKLTEWKLEKGVRILTAYQAKRFAKSLNS